MLQVPAWLALDVYSMVILGLLLFYYRQQTATRTLQRRYLSTMLVYTLMLVVAHLLGQLATPDFVLPGIIGNFASIAFDICMILFWFAYCEIWAAGDDDSTNTTATHTPWVWAFRIPVVVNVILGVIGLWTGWFFYYDASGVYHRGPLFDAHAAVMVAMVVVAEVYLYLKRRDIPTSAFPFLVAFPVAPLGLGLLQFRFAGLPLEFGGFVVSLSLLHFFVQNRDANTDALTGVGNRRKLDVLLESRVMRAQSGTSFGGVMCDVDKFKQINDTYGHHQGDVALEAVADVLARSFRHSDLVARYGGDEFFVITEIHDRQVLDNAIGRVRANLDDYNSSADLPYALSISLGYGIYDPASDDGVPGFRARLDTMLYEEKKRKAAETGDAAYLDRGRDGRSRGIAPASGVAPKGGDVA